MARGENITTKFKADISDLKKGITEANREIKQSNSEFKAVSSGMDNWGKSTDGISAKLKQLNTNLDAQVKKQTSYKKQLDLTKQAEQASGQQVDELRKKYNEAVKVYGENSAEAKEYAKQLKAAEKEQQANTKAAQDLNVKINNQQATINKTEKEIQQYQRELDQMKNKTRETEAATKQFNEVVAGVANKGLALLKRAAQAAGVALAGAATYAIKAGTDFQTGMADVAAISGATGDDLTALTEKAKEMGAQTKFSATESAEAFKYMAMAGWDTADMLNGIEGIMSLAAAAGGDLGRVSDIVTDALTAFGLATDQAGRFADVLAAASSNANTNVELMGATFQYAAPIAGALGYSIEDTAVAIGLMANAGIKGDKAGTALRSTFTRLASPPKEAARAMEALGVSITNADGTMKPLSETMEDLRAGFAKLTPQQKAQEAAAIAGKNAMSGLLAIVNASDDDFEKLTLAVDRSAGASKRMADTMIDNVPGAFTIMKSALEGTAIQVFEHFAKPVQKAIEEVTKMVNRMGREFAKPVMKKALDDLGKAAGELIKLFGNIATTVLPKLVQGLAFVSKNMTTVVTAFLAAKVAALAMRTNMLLAADSTAKLTLAQKAFVVVQNILNGTLTASAIASNIASKAMLALPYVAVAAGIIGLVAGITSFINKQNEATEADRERMEVMDENIAKQEELKEAGQELLQTEYGQIKQTQNLAEELKGLVNEKGEVAEADKNRVRFILGELNGALGTELQLIDNLVVGEENWQEAITNSINKKRGEILLKSIEPQYNDAITKSLERQIEANRLKSDIETMTAEKSELLAKIAVGANENLSQAERDRITTDILTLTDSINTKTELYDKAQTEVGGYYDTIALYEQAASLVAAGTAESIQEAEGMIVQSQLGIAENTTKSLEEQRAGWQSYYDWLKTKATGEQDDWYTQELLRTEQKMNTIGEQIDGMTSTVDTKLPEWANKWAELGESGIKELEWQSPAMYQTALNYAAQAVQGAEDKEALFKEYGKKYGSGFETNLRKEYDRVKKAGEELGGEAEKGASKNETDFGNLGDDYATGFLNKKDNWLTSFFNFGLELTANAVAGGKKGQNSGSPSKATAQLMDWFGQGYINTGEKWKSKFYNIGDKLTALAVKGAGNNVNAKDAGEKVASSFASGLTSKIKDGLKQTKEVIEDALNVDTIGNANVKQNFTSMANGLRNNIDKTNLLQQQQFAVGTATGNTNVDYHIEQNNYSPQPLDPNEQYLNTRRLVGLIDTTTKQGG